MKYSVTTSIVFWTGLQSEGRVGKPVAVWQYSIHVFYTLGTVSRINITTEHASVCFSSVHFPSVHPSGGVCVCVCVSIHAYMCCFALLFV